MPALGRPPATFVAIWVEDGTAKLWRVELNSGAMDEIARFAVEGLTRPAILELARIFVRGNAPQRSTNDDVSVPMPATNGPVKRPIGRPRKDGTPPRPRPKGAKRYDYRLAGVRQAELLEALERHPEGIDAKALMVELGRPVTNGAGVPLGVLRKQGHAFLVDGKWYPVSPV